MIVPSLFLSLFSICVSLNLYTPTAAFHHPHTYVAEKAAHTPYVKTIYIPMRDGTLLPADLYLPEENAAGLPCILARTPYGRARHAEEYTSITTEGYAVVVQDIRSAIDTECKTFPYFTDAQDGYDTVEYLAAQSFTNGKIATTGISARGIAQNMLAPSAPPHLVFQHIGFAPSSLYEALYQGGVLQKDLVEGWFARYASNPAVLAFVQAQHSEHAFWSKYDSAAAADKINTPALHYGGWYDLFLQGTLKSFTTRQGRGKEGAKDKQTLVVGPWTHHWNHGVGLETTPWPKTAAHPPMNVSLSYWMQRYLKGEQKSSSPAVTYYVMGPLEENTTSGHVWKQADTWPVPAEKQTWQLFTQGPQAKNVREALVMEPKASTAIALQTEPEAVFTFLPSDPVPTIGGRNLFLPSGPLDQGAIEKRGDCLVFTSAPLSSDLEVTGPLEAFLFCLPGADVMDVAVRLTDVYPDGRSLLISEGLTRVRSEGSEKQMSEVHVDLWATSQVFAKGHRIRLVISASHFPKYSLPEVTHVAHHRLLCGQVTPSRLILPVVQ